MNNKKQLLAAIASILLSIAIVSFAAKASTSIGNDISVGGDLDIVGQELQATTGVLNISTSSSMTTIRGTFNVDEAVTLDSTLTVAATSTLASTTVTYLVMGGNIVMSDKSITGIDTLTFIDTAGTVAGIQNQNLLDKTATESISGEWTHTATTTLATTSIARALVTNLTSGRVPIASTGGWLTDDSDLTFLTDTLTVTKFATTSLAGKITGGGYEIEGDLFDINGGTVDSITSLTVSNNVDIGNYDIRALSGTFDGLTSGRVVIAGANGLLGDDSDFTFSTDTLTITKIASTTMVGKITAGGYEIEGSNFDINGGAIDNTPIGATTATTGAFTTLSATATSSLTTTTLSGDLDLNLNQLKQAVLEKLADFPSSPAEGQMFWSTATSTPYWYDEANTRWRTQSHAATFVVAAVDSLGKWKADYVCDGVDDGATIQTAINSLPTTDVSSESWTVGPFTQYDALNAVGSWAAVQSDETLSADTGDKQEGSASLKIAGGTTDNPGAKLTGLASLDWSGYNTIELWVKTDSLVSFQLKVGDGSGYSHVYDDRILYANTWTHVQFDLRDPYKVETYAGVRFDWTDITEVHISVETATNSYTFRIDDLRLNNWHLLDHDGLAWQSDAISGYTRGTDYYVNFRDGRIRADVHGGLTSGNSYDVDYSYHTGGTVELLEGIYYLDTFVDYTRVSSAVYYGISLESRTVLRGQGEATVLKVTDTISDNLVPILVCQSRGVSILSLTIDGNTPTVSNLCTGIQLRNSRSCRISDCLIKDTTNHFVGIHGSQDVIISGNRTIPYYDNPEPTHGIDVDFQAGSGDKPEEGWWGYRGARYVSVVKNNLYNHSSNVDYGQAFKIENGMDIIFANNTVRGIVSVNAPDDSRMRTQNISIVGNTIREDYYVGLDLNARDGGVIVSNNTLYNTGMIVSNHANGENSEVLVQGNEIFNPPYRGIHIVNCLAGDIVNIKDNILHGDGRDYGIYVDSVGTIKCDGNTISNFATGIFVDTTATGLVSLDHNTTRNCSGGGVSIHTDNVTLAGHISEGDGNLELYGASNCSIENCTIRNNTGNQAIRVAGSSHHNLITGNKVINSDKIGIYVSSGDDNYVSNNLVIGSSQDADASHPNIRVSGVARTTIIGNTLRDGGGANQPNYGLYITGTYTRVINNDLYDAGKTAAVLLSGTTNIFRGNIGYVTENSGTTTISSGNTYVAVTHSLDAQPATSTISIIPFNNLGNASSTSYWVSDVGASTFRINVGIDPGASGADFSWNIGSY